MSKIPVCADWETHLIKAGMAAPKPVCMAFKDGDTEKLLAREEGLDLYERVIEEDTQTNHHIFYDLGVAAASRPQLVPKIFKAFEEGRIHCTKIRQQMIDNAYGRLKYEWDPEKGEFKKQNFSLFALMMRHFGIDLAKEKTGDDAWRLKYHTLEGVPISEYPEGARTYPIGDVRHTQMLHAVQQEDINPLVNPPGYEDEMRSAWALNLMSTWGFRTDGPAVEEYKRELVIQYAKQVEQCQEFKFRRGGKKASRDMKAIRAAVEKWYGDHDMKMKLTKGGDIATDREQLTDTDHPGLNAVAESVKTEKLLSTYIPALERGTVVPMNPNYNPIIETFRTSCSGGMKIDKIPVGMNCFDGETEILTSRGWVPFSKLASEATTLRVAQWDEGEISFANNWRYIEKENREDLYTINNQHIDLVVTGDHRCPLISSKGKFKVVPAREYNFSNHKQLHAGEYAGGVVRWSAPEIALLCAIQADGSWHSGGIDFSFTKKRKAKRLKWALDQLEATYSYKRSKKGRHRFRVQKQSTGHWFRLLGEQKRFDSWLLDMDRSSLELFCAEVFFWDGCYTRMNHYSCNDKHNTDWVQIALVLTNKRAKVRAYQGQKNLNYQIDLTHRNYSLTTNAQAGRVACKRVYCVSVPSSFVVVRRNGKVMISGNCQNLPRGGRVRQCVIPRTGWVFGFCDYDTLEMLTLAQVCLDLFGFSAIADAAWEWDAVRDKQGLDFHAAMAADMLRIPYADLFARLKAGDKNAKEARQGCKIANYGMAGGMSWKTFIKYAKGFGVIVTPELAQKLHAQFRGKWIEMPYYFQHISFLCREGRADQIIFPRTGMFRGKVSYTAACNGNFQHLAAKGAKRALWMVAYECYVDAGSPLYGCRPWLFAHDEIGMEIPYDAIGPRAAHEAMMRLEQIMVEAMKYWCPDVPIAATGAMVRRWYKGADAVFQNGIMVPSKPVVVGKDAKGYDIIEWHSDL